MNANWTGFSCALLALAAFILVYWWGSRQSLRCASHAIAARRIAPGTSLPHEAIPPITTK